MSDTIEFINPDRRIKFKYNKKREITIKACFIRTGQEMKLVISNGDVSLFLKWVGNVSTTIVREEMMEFAREMKGE